MASGEHWKRLAGGFHHNNQSRERPQLCDFFLYYTIIWPSNYIIASFKGGIKQFGKQHVLVYRYTFTLHSMSSQVSHYACGFYFIMSVYVLEYNYFTNYSINQQICSFAVINSYSL